MDATPVYIEHPDLLLGDTRRRAVAILEWERHRTEPAPSEHDLFVSLHYCARKALTLVADNSRRKWTSAYRRLFAVIADINIGLVFAMVSSWHKWNADNSEMESDTLLAFYRAIRGFDPWCGYRFSTFACNCIQRACSNSMRQTEKLQSRFGEEFREDYYYAAQHSTSRPMDTEMLYKVLNHNLANLTPREQIVIARRFPLTPGSKRLTLEVLGDEIGLTRQRVQQIQSKALRKLKSVLRSAAE